MFRRGFYGIGSCFNNFGFMYGGRHVIAFVIFAVLAAVAILYFVRKTKKHTNNAALEELKIRFAKGEITEDEYIRMKNIL